MSLLIGFLKAFYIRRLHQSAVSGEFFQVSCLRRVFEFCVFPIRFLRFLVAFVRRKGKVGSKQGRLHHHQIKPDSVDSIVTTLNHVRNFEFRVEMDFSCPLQKFPPMTNPASLFRPVVFSVHSRVFFSRNHLNGIQDIQLFLIQSEHIHVTDRIHRHSLHLCICATTGENALILPHIRKTYKGITRHTP